MQMRHWVGIALVALAGLGSTWWSAAAERPWWQFALIAVGTAVGIGLQVPVLRRETPKPQPDRWAGSATFRGNLSNVRMTNVRSQADMVVDGDVRDSVIDRIWHQPRRGGGRR